MTRATEHCPRCGRKTIINSGHGSYCPSSICKWGWEVEMDGSSLKPPEQEEKQMAFDPKSDVVGFIPKEISIRFIDHAEQRYPTAGDYFESGLIGQIIIHVSKMKDKRYEFLVAIHELIEMCLCDSAGIPNEEIDRFDKAHLEDEDPGSLNDSPYYKQHMIAMGVEMIVAQAMGVKWRDYENHLNSLFVKSLTK